MKTLVVLPSYNESQNIIQLVEAILNTNPTYDVCVVDDSSPDGTSQLVEKTIREKNWTQRVHLITRSKKDGRGGAVRDGFAWGMASGRGYGAYVEMDCDFSHEPQGIEKGLALLKPSTTDVVIGARYPNGTIVGWPLSRRVLSFCANTLARLLIDFSVPDYTNGFRFYSTKAVETLLTYRQKNKGYIYLSESLSQLLRAGFKAKTFPIYFKNRERGVSNTNFKEVSSALKGIFSIAWEHRFSK